MKKQTDTRMDVGDLEIAFHKLGVLKTQLPILKSLFLYHPERFNAHSDASKNIGRVLGNPSAWNSDAHLGAGEYLNQLNKEAFVRGDFDYPQFSELFNEVWISKQECDEHYANAKRVSI